jgi:CBS domain-containing protein
MNARIRARSRRRLAGGRGAWRSLNARKITALFVVDADRRACGVVHLHDLLRLGAA